MKLFYSPNSPFARKCRVVILEKELSDSIEPISLLPSDNPPELLATNPLGTVPALLKDDGTALCESPVICEYLDSLSGKNPLFPQKNNDYFAVMALAALADGIMDAAVSCVMEGRRPEEKRYEAWTKRKENAIARTISKIGELGISKKSDWNIATINLAIALEYVCFRLPHLNWESNNKELYDWLEFINKKPSMQETKPVP